MPSTLLPKCATHSVYICQDRNILTAIPNDGVQHDGLKERQAQCISGESETPPWARLNQHKRRKLSHQVPKLGSALYSAAMPLVVTVEVKSAFKRTRPMASDMGNSSKRQIVISRT